MKALICCTICLPGFCKITQAFVVTANLLFELQLTTLIGDTLSTHQWSNNMSLCIAMVTVNKGSHTVIIWCWSCHYILCTVYPPEKQRYIHAYRQTDRHNIHAYTHIHIYICTHICTNTTHVHTHTYIRTHTQTIEWTNRHYIKKSLTVFELTRFSFTILSGDKLFRNKLATWQWSRGHSQLVFTQILGIIDGTRINACEPNYQPFRTYPLKLNISCSRKCKDILQCNYLWSKYQWEAVRKKLNLFHLWFHYF